MWLTPDESSCLSACRTIGLDNPQLMNGHIQLRNAKLILGYGCQQPKKEVVVELSKDINIWKVSSSP